MTPEQVYILNRALDGKDIYSMPSFEGFDMSELTVSMYKDNLIGEGFLETHYSFTDEGLKTTKLILDFKNAKKYVTILDMVLGLIDDRKAVVLQCINNDYSFSLVNITDAAEQLVSVYKFLSLSTRKDTGGMPMEPDEFFKFFDLNRQNSFNLITEQNEEIIKEIVFSYNIGIYVYDCTEKLLYQKSDKGIKALLSERMRI